MGNEQTKGGELVQVPVDFGEVMIRQTDRGFMRPVAAKMQLSESAGHVNKISGKYAISKAGFIRLNKVASINLVTPDSVVVDGKRQPNPYIERNKKTRLIESVHLKRIGVGYSPTGNIVVIDRTVNYNLYVYLIQSFQAKMDADEWETNKETKRGRKTGAKKFPDCAFYGTEVAKPGIEGNWVFYEIAHPVGIWVDITNPAIQACLAEHIQRQKFGDRIAQTIVDRNILKDHPAIAISQVDGPNPTVTVHGYRHDMTTDNIQSVMEQAENGSKDIKIDAKVIEAEVEEIEAAEAEAVDEAKPEDNDPNGKFFEPGVDDKAEGEK